jgi:hypothetical protein
VSPSPVVRRMLLIVALLLLTGLGWTGISGGLHQLPESHTLGQRVQSLSQLGYGVLSVLAVLTSVWGRRWRPLILACWTVCVTLAGGFASVVWGGTTLLIGVISGAAALLVALAIIWLLHVGRVA